MKLKKVYPIIITTVIALFIEFVFVALLLRPKPLAIGTVDLSTVSDGEYIGFCQNKILFAVVKVDVKDHEITDIEVLEHKPSYMEQAKQIADSITEKNSLEVDTISGATLTGDTVKKAVENAFIQGKTN